MAKKLTKAEEKAVGSFLIIGTSIAAAIWLIQKAFIVLKTLTPLIVILIFIAFIYFIYKFMKKTKRLSFEKTLDEFFDVNKNEIMQGFHSCFFRENSGEYSRETKNKWYELIVSFMNKFELPKEVLHTPQSKQNAATYIHKLALQHEEKGALTYDFSNIDSHESLITKTILELEVNGWKLSKIMEDNLSKIDLKAEKNDKKVVVQCIYDVGKIGVKKVRKKLLDARPEVNDKVIVLSLHGFTNQATKLCDEVGATDIKPNLIPFIDNIMGI